MKLSNVEEVLRILIVYIEIKQTMENSRKVQDIEIKQLRSQTACQAISENETNWHIKLGRLLRDKQRHKSFKKICMKAQQKDT